MAKLISSFAMLVIFFTLLSCFAEGSGSGTGASNSSSSLRGFSLVLIHRDSPLSPLYNSSLSQSELMEIAAERSFSRANHLISEISAAARSGFDDAVFLDDNITSDVRFLDGLFLMKFSMGTPPVETFAIVDTGSDLIWVQCHPCDYQNSCYKQNAPLFDPRKSSTYQGNLRCDSPLCNKLPENSKTCQYKWSTCTYAYYYGDFHSFSYGDLCQETFTFSSSTDPSTSVAIPQLAFGCGHNNFGPFFYPTSAGIVGLGGGPLSLVSQLLPDIDYRFSYCLVPPQNKNNTGRLFFGSTPLSGGPQAAIAYRKVSPTFSPRFYFVTLTRVSMENSSTPRQEVTLMIDCGSALTSLPPSIYDPLKEIVEEHVLFIPQTPPSKYYDLCYLATDLVFDLTPNMTFYFEGPFGEAAVTLTTVNLFVRVQDIYWCLAIVPSTIAHDVVILGMYSQLNLYVEFDIYKGSISFQPHDCSKPI